MPKVRNRIIPRPSRNGSANRRTVLDGFPQLREAWLEIQREAQARKAAGGKSRLDYVAQQFSGSKPCGEGYKALCPLHGDSSPSLSISTGEDGRVLVKCFAGCQTDHVLQAVGLSYRDLFPDNPLIVQQYDYREEAGELLYQVCRFDPKDFRQRRPDGEGGWTWKLKGVRRVPYRLPELLKADPAQPVFVVEGEKDADRLVSLGLVATTNAGGAGKWKDEYNEPLQGRNVVILPDNDETGRDHANAVADSLHGIAASVRIVTLPGLRAKGDVSDWLETCGGSAEELLAIVRRTAPLDGSTGRLDDRSESSSGRVNRRPVGSEPDESQPDASKPVEPSSSRPVDASGSVAAFPVSVLPKPLQRFVYSVARALPCPPDFPGAMLLPVLAALVGRKRCVEVKESWTEYPTLWISCVARSGDRKTPAFQIVTEPLREIQSELYAKYLMEKEAYQNKERDKPPVLRQVFTSDATIEALKRVLAGNPNGIVFLADELSGWARGIGQYKSGKGDDRQHWLSIWSGQTVVCNRVSLPEPIVIHSPFVSVTGGIQPDAIGDLIDDAREDGFSARILFSYPEPIPAGDWSEAVVQGAEAYRAVCRALWNLKPSDRPLTFSPAAKARWVDWVNAHRREEPPDNLRAMWSKAEGHCARLALLLFLTRRACGEAKWGLEIDPASIDGAVQLIDYFKAHAKRVYGVAAVGTDRGRIGNALRWIRKQGGTVTAKKLQQFGLAEDSTAAKKLLADLAELGHGTVTKEARHSLVFRLSDRSTDRPDDQTTDGESEVGDAAHS